MAASIAGVIWRAVRFIRECRRGAVSSGRHEGMFPGRYLQTNGLGGRLWYILNLGCRFSIEAELGIWGQNLLELVYGHTSQLELPFMAPNGRTYALNFRSS